MILEKGFKWRREKLQPCYDTLRKPLIPKPKNVAAKCKYLVG